MNMYEIIFRKRNGNELSADEIDFFVKGVTDGSISDQQIAAWLMASFIRGLSKKEMTALTQAMTRSGDSIDLSAVPGRKVDKHSTGGVGDGTSLALAPLLACYKAVVVPMMSGRGLGHTGGTLDKLESISGFRVNLSEDEFRSKLRDVGCAIIGQTARVAPADKKLYALRDVTATVDSVPLIAASIMSKKLAEGTEHLVLDVKTGTGAFMQTLKESRELARAMVVIGNGAGVKTLALITDMNQPLGDVAGNALEVHQAIEVLKGNGPQDFREMILTLAAWMLVVSGCFPDVKKARADVENLLRSGRALQKFGQMIGAQGGDARVVEQPEKFLPLAPFQKDILSPRSGAIQKMDTRLIGLAIVDLGAGRSRPEDPVDYGVGLKFLKKMGDSIKKGEPLARVFARREDQISRAQDQFLAAVTIGAKKIRRPKLVYELIK